MEQDLDEILFGSCSFERICAMREDVGGDLRIIITFKDNSVLDSEI